MTFSLASSIMWSIAFRPLSSGCEIKKINIYFYLDHLQEIKDHKQLRKSFRYQMQIKWTFQHLEYWPSTWLWVKNFCFQGCSFFMPVFSWQNVWIFCNVLFDGEWMKPLWHIYPAISLGIWTILPEKKVQCSHFPF